MSSSQKSFYIFKTRRKVEKMLWSIAVVATHVMSTPSLHCTVLKYLRISSLDPTSVNYILTANPLCKCYTGRCLRRHFWRYKCNDLLSKQNLRFRITRNAVKTIRTPYLDQILQNRTIHQAFQENEICFVDANGAVELLDVLLDVLEGSCKKTSIIFKQIFEFNFLKSDKGLKHMLK